MTRLNSAGFELNSNTTGVEFATCNGTGATIQGTTKRTGSYAGKILDPASGVRTGWSMFCDNSAGDDKKARAYIYIVAYPDVNTTILSFEETSSLTSDLSHTSGIRLKTDGKLQLINGSGTQIGSDSGVLSLNTWYRIELQAENAAANNLAEGLIDGSSFASTAVAAFAGDANRFLRIGANMRAEACTSGEWYFDDIACNVVSGSVQNDWPGAGSLDLVLPDGAGDYAEGADGAGGGAAWQEIDEIPPDDATTYWLLQANSTNASTADRLAVTLGAMSSATSVTLAQAIVRAMPDTNAACSFTLGFKTQASGTLVEGTNTSITGTAWVTHDDTSTSKAPKLTVYTDPQGGGALTETLINGSQLQIRCPDATPDVRVTFLGLYVEYVPGASGIDADVPVGLIDFLGIAPGTSKSAAVPIGLAELLGVTPATSKASAVSAGLVELTGIEPAHRLSTVLDAVVLELIGLAPATTKAAPVPAAGVDFLGVAPGALKAAALSAVSFELLGVAPTALFSAAVPAVLVEFTAPPLVESNSADVPAASVEFAGVSPGTTKAAAVPVFSTQFLIGGYVPRGPKYFLVAAEVSDGLAAWTNPANAVTEDDLPATVALDAGGATTSNRLDFTSVQKYQGIADGDAVDQVRFDYRIKVTSGIVQTASVQLLLSGTPVGVPVLNQAGTADTSYGFASTGYIDVADFGVTLLGSDLQNLGVRLQFEAFSGSFTLSLDAVHSHVRGTFIPLGTSKAASLSPGLLELAGVTPSAAKSATAGTGLVELLGVEPGTTKSATLSAAALEFLGISPAALFSAAVGAVGIDLVGITPATSNAASLSPVVFEFVGAEVTSDAATVITDIGLEWTLPNNLMHYALAANRMDFTLPLSREHWTLQTEDNE